MRFQRLLVAAFALVVASVSFAERPALPDTKIPLLDGTWSNDADKFSFAILGDKTSGGEGKWPIYDRAVDAINLLDPDFVITVGDQIPGHMQERGPWDAEWAEYMEHAKRIEAPLFLTVGNHDIANTECYRFWQEDFGKTYYSFDYKGCHFLVLNTEEERFDGRGPVWQAMMTWMEDDLAKHADARHTFIFFHKPMWDDPRFQQDWARVEKALADRPFTVVAGHEHYLATERKNGNLYVIQNATGGGIRLSDVKEIGCFQGFGFVTVDGDKTSYAIIEDEGGIWPVDVAPLSFRKAINNKVATVDAVSHRVLDNGVVDLETKVIIDNVLSKPIDVRLSLRPLASGWHPVNAEAWQVGKDSVVAEVSAAPGQRLELPLGFHIAPDAAGYPPRIDCEVVYDGATLDKETMPMEEMPVVPLYPRAAFKAVPQWNLVGPFSIGPIDTHQLPEHPHEANANMFKRFGPEDGFDGSREYEGGLRWHEVDAHPNGLLNYNALMGTADEAVGYALCGVYSPEPQHTHVAMYADNYAQAILNGTLVESVEDMGWAGGYVFVPVDLEQGWNTLIIKVINNRGDWFARVLVADPNGNLRFAAKPE